MKPNLSLSCVLLGLSLISTAVDARDARGAGDGRSGGDKTSSSASRSPATGSKIQRPAAKPAPQPAARIDTKPAARPTTKPAPAPVKRPSVERPTSRPDSKPNLNRPDGKPDLNRPDGKPDLNRPDGKPDLNRPDGKPDLNRPGNNQGPLANRPNSNRPSTLPGMVSYPDRPGKDKPGRTNIDRDKVNIDHDRTNIDRDKVNIDRDRTNIDRNKVNIDRDRTNIDRNKVNIGDRNINNVHIDQVNVGRRNVGLNRPATLPAGRRDWNDNQWGGKNSIWGNNVNIGNNVNVNIDNNFRRNNNFAYRPNYWGARPWWGAGNCHGWHHGHWNYGWNSNHYHNHWYDDDDDFASGFMWGIAVWSLGNMIYDMGYNTYRNPYPAPPVQNTTINYAQPVSVTAAANPPGDEAATALAETKSAEAVDRSRTAFKQGDYIGALKSVDESLGHTPGDVALHEYRALVLFALGKYADAAGVLNPVLASGPGWGWDTMVGFYDSSSTYDGQLRKLESYVKGKPDGAQGHFLLGYHYMVCGHMDKAYSQFEQTVRLQPADSIARQLRDLTKSSLPDDGGEETTPPARPEPVPSEKLVGTWVSDRGQDGKITFKMTEDGNYSWSYTSGGKTTDLKGTYGLDDKGLLVLTADDSQMVSEVTLTGDKQMQFVLVGAPDGDPGLEFKKG